MFIECLFICSGVAEVPKQALWNVGDQETIKKLQGWWFFFKTCSVTSMFNFGDIFEVVLI